MLKYWWFTEVEWQDKQQAISVQLWKKDKVSENVVVEMNVRCFTWHMSVPIFLPWHSNPFNSQNVILFAIEIQSNALFYSQVGQLINFA